MYNKIDLREVPAERLKEISLDLVDIDAQAPEFEPNRQFYFMAKARDYVKRKSAELGRPMTFFTQTFGCPLDASYEEWIHINHYEKIDERVAKWLYRQEKGYIASLGDATLKEIAAERIEEFTAALRKYML